MSVGPKPYEVRSGLEGLEPAGAVSPSPRSEPHRSRAERLGRRPAEAAPDTSVPTVAQVDVPRRKTGRGRQPTSTWLPSRLITLVKGEYERRGIGAGELFKEALEFSADDMGDLVAQSKRRPSVQGGGLFAAPPPTGRSRAFDEPTGSITYRMSKADQQVLDDLTRKWGATSRGHLIGCALDHYFHHND